MCSLDKERLGIGTKSRSDIEVKNPTGSNKIGRAVFLTMAESFYYYVDKPSVKVIGNLSGGLEGLM